MSKKGILTAGVLAFILLCVLCVLSHVESIHRGLGPPAEGGLRAPLLEGSWIGGKFTLKGTVASEAEKDQILSRVSEIYGSGEVMDILKVNKETAGATWLPGVLGLLSLMGKGVENAYLKVEGKEIILKGEVATEERKASLIKEAQAGAGPGLQIVDQLQVAPPRGGEAKVQASIDEWIAGQTIEFDVGSAAISPRGVALLDKLVPILQSAPRARIEIGGHTDNTGDPGYNLDLSRRRATAVRQYLMSRGVGEKRLTAVGYGQEKPVADNDTPQGRLKNRRIEFKIHKGE
jgi:OOP family OmpA-OmpF porin